MEVFSKNFLNILLGILLNLAVTSAAPTKRLNASKEIRNKFDKLLSEIADMNEKRLDNLKKFTELDSYKSAVPSAAPSKHLNASKEVRSKFGKLLSEIANMNEKRLDVLKEFMELDSYKAGDALLRRKPKEKVTVLNEEVTKDLVQDTLRDVVCRGDMNLKLNKYKDLVKKVEKESLNDVLLLDDDNTRGVINRILRELICRKRSKKTPVIIQRDRDSSHDTVVRSDLPSEEKRRLRIWKHYVKSNKYKPGNAIFYEADDKNGEHIDDVILVNDWHTQNTIYNVMRDMICHGSVAPVVSGYRRAGSNKILSANNKAIITETLHDMICIKEKKTGRSPPRRYSNFLTEYFDQFDDQTKKHKRNKESSESVLSSDISEDSDSSDCSDSNNNSDSNYSDSDDSDLSDDFLNDLRKNDIFESDLVNDENNDIALQKGDKDYYNNLYASADSNDKSKDHIDKDDNFDSDEDNTNESLDLGSLEVHAEVLRSSCWKDAVKTCKRACKTSLRDVCDHYNCSREMKKAFRQSCKRHCKEY